MRLQPLRGRLLSGNRETPGGRYRLTLAPLPGSDFRHFQGRGDDTLLLVSAHDLGVPGHDDIDEAGMTLGGITLR